MEVAVHCLCKNMKDSNKEEKQYEKYGSLTDHIGLFKMGDFHKVENYSSLFAHRKMTGKNKEIKTRNEHERFQTWLNTSFKSEFFKLRIFI